MLPSFASLRLAVLGLDRGGSCREDDDRKPLPEGVESGIGRCNTFSTALH